VFPQGDQIKGFEDMSKVMNAKEPKKFPNSAKYDAHYDQILACALRIESNLQNTEIWTRLNSMPHELQSFINLVSEKSSALENR
jgi:uncharacterized membrane protein